jgi:hypothetical protein
MNDRLIALLMLALIFTLIGGCIGWYLKPCPCGEASAVQATTVQIDTVTKYITHDPIYVHAKARVVTQRDTVHETDTVYRTPAFVAILDTIVKHDTIGIEYAFPQHTFSVALRQGRDSISYEVRTLTITNYEQRPWWMDALTHIGAATLGYSIAQIK